MGPPVRDPALAARARTSPPRGGSAVDVARGWLREHAAAFGLTTAQVDSLALVRDHVLPGTGTARVNLVQTTSGVAASVAVASTSPSPRTARILSYAGDPTPGTTLTSTWVLGDAGALAAAGGLAPARRLRTEGGRHAGRLHTFAKGPFGGPSYVKKATFGTKDGPVAAYKVYFIKSPSEAWEVVVDGTTGKVLYRASVVQFEGDPEGTVYDNYPGAAKGGSPACSRSAPSRSRPRAGSTRPASPAPA